VTRVLLIGLFLVFLARAIWRLLDGIISGAGRSSSPRTPLRGEHMVRDPVCGTFVLPSRALSVGRGDETRYFCSERCRAAFERQSHADGALRS